MSVSRRARDGVLAGLVGWPASVLAFGVIGLVVSPEFEGVRPVGWEEWGRLWLLYSTIGAFFALLLIPPLAVLFSLEKPARWRAGWGRVLGITAGWALLLSGILVAAFASSRMDVREMLPPLFLTCWAATLAGAAYVRRRRGPPDAEAGEARTVTSPGKAL